MFKAFRDDPESQGLNARNGLVSILAVAQDAGQRWHFGNPPAVVFTFKLDGEGHAGTVTFGPAG